MLVCETIDKTQIFIKKSIEKHGNKYSYNKANYIGSKTKLIIVCPVHGPFSQIPSDHLSGKGCSDCGGSKPKTTEHFILEAQEIHKDENGDPIYDYSDTDYTNTHTKICIKCPIHGPFSQTPGNHLTGHGCLDCSGRKTKTIEQVIKKAQEIHKDKDGNPLYGYYSDNEYKNIDTKVPIKCNIHGIFQQTFYHHIHRKQGCPKCSIIKNAEKRKTPLEQVIKKAQKIHIDENGLPLYGYSHITEYKNTHAKVPINCKNHGIFYQVFSSHLNGAGCPDCYGNKLKTTEQFVIDAREIHKDENDIPLYDYSLTEYKGAHTKIYIKCKIHGLFSKTPDKHMQGSGCSKCGIIKIKEKLTKTTEQFIRDAQLKHINENGDPLYDYSLTEYITAIKLVTIKCNTHGIFQQSPNSHLSKKRGCPKCGRNSSKAENKWLDSLDVPQENRQHKIFFNEGKNHFQVDGYNPITKTCYEFHGDYYHANPDVYRPCFWNKNLKQFAYEIHLDTINKINKLKELGYNVIEIWENDWNNN